MNAREIPDRRPAALRCRLFSELLVAIACWTLVIKFAFPLLFEVALWLHHARGRTLSAAAPGVMWDFWWVAHLALAYGFASRRAWAWPFGLLVAGAEVGIVAGKLYSYFMAPDVSFLRLNWLVNKVAVLALFATMLPFLLRAETRRFLSEPAP